MSVPLSPDSPRRTAARAFGRELRRALTERRVGWRQLNAAVGRDVHTLIDRYKRGLNLPRLDTAIALADALDAPRLIDIVREARTGVCPVDGRTFLNEGGHAKLFCSPGCRQRAAVARARSHDLEGAEAAAYRSGEPEKVLVARLKQELHRARQHERRHGGGGGYVRRREVAAAIAQWESASVQSRHRGMKIRLDEHLAAVERMCRGCEPDGFCTTVDCPLRPVSPLPLKERIPVELAEPMRIDGGWGRDPAADAERRAKVAAGARRWWEGLTPAERVEHLAKMRTPQVRAAS